MDLRQPLQVLALSPSGNLLAVACGRILSVVDIKSNKIIGKSNADNSHARNMMIRQLVWHTDAELLSSGEDKQVKEWRVPAADAEGNASDLSLEQQFEIPKRANAISVTGDGQTIVIADKFGDVYTFPMHGCTLTLPTPPTATQAPTASTSATPVEDEAAPEPMSAAPGEARTTNGKRRKVGNTHGVAPEWRHVPARISSLTPRLGHVSMLTAMLVIPEQNKIITADRDEHVRVSKWPNSWEIEHFLLGYKKFVSALALHPSDPNVLITAGGDTHLRLWDLTTYRCIRKDISVEALVGTAEIKVELESQKIGRRMRQRMSKKAQKKAEKEQGLVSSQNGASNAPAKSEGKEEEEIADPTDEIATNPVKVKTKKLDLGITQMCIVASAHKNRPGMLVVSSVGSSALLAWSIEAILHAKSDSLQAQMIHFEGPVLSITTGSTSPSLWVSLDVSRSPATVAVRVLDIKQDGQVRHMFAAFGHPNKRVRHADFDANLKLGLREEATVSTIRDSCSFPVTEQEPYPNVAALFPDTALLSKEPARDHGDNEGGEIAEPGEEEHDGQED